MSKKTIIFLIVAALVLWSQGPWSQASDQRHNLKFWILFLATLAWVISFLGPRLTGRKRPTVSDTDFTKELELASSGLPHDALIAERRYVSGVLGVAATKLRADEQLDDLTKELDFLGSCAVALNDLQEEIKELYEASSQEVPPPPETIGALVLQLARGRVAASARKS